jgi:putative GTP pyrophosphokinase
VRNVKLLTSEQLKERAIRFFDRYGKDLEQIRQLLNIRLIQLALAYTIANNLPYEAVMISTRVKTLKSFLNKLKNKGWPQFYYPNEVASDLVGARVICWFIDDCEGMRKLISSSNHLKVTGDIEDYINKVYEKNISEIASRLADEDQLLINLRNAYQSLADEKSKNKTREGFHED